MKKLCSLLVLLLGCSGGLQAPTTETVAPDGPATEDSASPILPGVVVETVPEGTALAKAGIQPGDVLLSWKRLPNPPANPEGAEGVFGSPFDFHDVRIEQAPRGTVEITGKRNSTEMRWSTSRGTWAGTRLGLRWTGEMDSSRDLMRHHRAKVATAAKT